MTPSEWYMSTRVASLSDACRSSAPASTAAVFYCSLRHQQSDVLLMFLRHGAVPPASWIPCWKSSCMAELVASGPMITSWIQNTAALQIWNPGCPSLLVPFHNPCITTTCSTTHQPICCCQCDTCLRAARYCLSSVSRPLLCRIRVCWQLHVLWCDAVCH